MMLNCFKGLHKRAKGHSVVSASLLCSQDTSSTCEQRALTPVVWLRLTVPACQTVLPLKTTRCVTLSYHLCGVNHQAVGAICTTSLFSCPSCCVECVHTLHSTGKQKSCLYCLAGHLFTTGKEMWGAPSVSESRSPKSATHCGNLPSLTVPVKKSYSSERCPTINCMGQPGFVEKGAVWLGHLVF